MKIKYTYSFLLIGLINLFISYFIYSIKILELNYLEILKDHFIEITSEDNDSNTCYYLDPSTISYDDNVESEFDEQFKYLNIQHFIDLQSTAIMFEHTLYQYKSKRKDIISLSSQNFDILSENYIETLLQSMLNIKLIFETIKFLEKRSFIKNLRIRIYSLYLISWLYILFVSLYTLYFTELESLFLQNFQDNVNPFSGITHTQN